MAFADPTAYSKTQINRTGDEIRGNAPSDTSLNIVNNWRASHAYILNTFQAMLRNRTRGTKIAVAQRHKRMRTIAAKLEQVSANATCPHGRHCGLSAYISRLQ
jgi:predicted metal-dependent hydrolase